MATDVPTGKIWSNDLQKTYDQARLSRGISFGFLASAGALTLATLAAYLITDPGSKIVRVGGEDEAPETNINLVPGGVVVSRGWTF